MIHSYSSLKMYLTCPYKYYRTYITKDVPRPSGPALARGTKVHDELEQAVKQKKTPHNIWMPDGLLEWVWSKGGRAEVPLAINNKLEWVDFWDSSAVLRGKLDVVVLDNKRVFAIDWKTGQHRVDTLQARVYRFLLMRGQPGTLTFMWVFVDQAISEARDYTHEGDKQVATLIHTINKHKTRDFIPKNNWMCGRFCEVPECPLQGE